METQDILIVEDEILNARFLEAILTELGHNIVACVTTGDGALEIFRENKVDFVFMDINIDGTIDGIESASLLNNYREVPIIYTTGFGRSEIIGRANDTNIYGYLIKPFDERDIEAVLSVAIHKTKDIFKLQDKTTHDKLTNAYNREYFEQNIEKIIANSIEAKSQLALSMLDIDFFKKVNDLFGHCVGDYVLTELVNLINKVSRKDDILIRWGGEEFVMILKIDSHNDLNRVVENIRLTIEEHSFETVGHITCSIGVSIYKTSEEINETFVRADEALYIAKDSGRNQTVIL